jgi:hypothetical protein
MSVFLIPSFLTFSSLFAIFLSDHFMGIWHKGVSVKKSCNPSSTSAKTDYDKGAQGCKCKKSCIPSSTSAKTDYDKLAVRRKVIMLT